MTWTEGAPHMYLWNLESAVTIPYSSGQ